MTVDGDRPGNVAEGVDAGAPADDFRLDAAVGSLYAERRLTPLLHALLAHSRRLVGGVAGSISVVDPAEGTYRKLAERGVACHVGRRFPLEEGATGRAFASRRPVVIDDYSTVAGAHLPPQHVASHGSVTAVPLWWRGDLIGVNVTFAGRPRRYTAAELDRLEVLTQSAAGAIVTAGAREPSIGRLIRDQMADEPVDGAAPPVLTEVGAVRAVPADVADAAVALVRSVRSTMGGPTAVPLHVAVLYRPEGIRLLVQAQGSGSDPRARPTGAEAAESCRLLRATGSVTGVEHVSGWGTVVRADIPFREPRFAVADVGPAVDPVTDALPRAVPSPLTAREAEVLALVARGWSDREIARALVLSPRTVEKHVGAALRKTGSTSRTGATVHAVERGWLSL